MLRIFTSRKWSLRRNSSSAGQFSVSQQPVVTTVPVVHSKDTSKVDTTQAQSRREDTTSMGAPSQDLLQQIDQHVMLPRTKEGKIDYDALYDAESDNESEDMESHGSVVTHVLSQVKIGMDLTKVVLPTFILERRSLLEMYADYFAHPDQFLKIVDMQTPHERMVQVVRWYLSSYHAGRKSAVAKKPYNPILGEIFRCYWDAVDESSAPETDRNVDTNTEISHNDTNNQHDGPIPWCNSNQLLFIAEQVSHHPPISAFYAEHAEKRIQFDAWVWTKSKFLGLSIGVQNIGKGIVTLLDHDEEYVLTFPNGYGRSILTIPWIELGGPVSVECPQTGHKAQIEFITKPFYGGKKHRVTCEIHSPEDKRPYYTATGEWNTRMEARWTESGRTDVLFEVSTMRAHRKRVSPVLKQSERESRRIWRHVTAALRARDEDAATRAKRYVEQAQRDAVREREEQGIVWQTQYFSEQVDEDGWMYMNPLKIRLHRHKKLRSTTLGILEKQPSAAHILNPR